MAAAAIIEKSALEPDNVRVVQGRVVQHFGVRKAGVRVVASLVFWG
jgi:hypothetical protein